MDHGGKVRRIGQDLDHAADGVGVAHEDGAIERLQRVRDAFSRRDKEGAGRNPVVEGEGVHGGAGRGQSAGQVACAVPFVLRTQVDNRPHSGLGKVAHVCG